jgi:hypothetical protein
VSDIRKLNALGWKPENGLEQIFEDYIEWIGDQGDLGAYFQEAERAMREQGVVKKTKEKGGVACSSSVPL